jgi:hypothetical protein
MNSSAFPRDLSRITPLEEHDWTTIKIGTDRPRLVLEGLRQVELQCIAEKAVFDERLDPLPDDVGRWTRERNECDNTYLRARTERHRDRASASLVRATKMLDSVLASQQKSNTDCATIISRLRRIFVGGVKVTIEAVDRRSDLTPQQKVRRMFDEVKRKFGCTDDAVVSDVEAQLDRMGYVEDAKDLLLMVSYIQALLPERRQHARVNDVFTVDRLIRLVRNKLVTVNRVWHSAVHKVWERLKTDPPSSVESVCQFISRTAADHEDQHDVLRTYPGVQVHSAMLGMAVDTHPNLSTQAARRLQQEEGSRANRLSGDQAPWGTKICNSVKDDVFSRCYFGDSCYYSHVRLDSSASTEQQQHSVSNSDSAVLAQQG